MKPRLEWFYQSVGHSAAFECEACVEQIGISAAYAWWAEVDGLEYMVVDIPDLSDLEEAQIAAEAYLLSILEGQFAKAERRVRAAREALRPGHEKRKRQRREKRGNKFSQVGVR